ncbi:MAG: hypothetical protein ABUT20_47930, partial [Bacteroidota bacterium]
MKTYYLISPEIFNIENKLVLGLLIFLLLASFMLHSQSQLLTYKVIRNGSDAGWVKINKNLNGPASIISMASEIKVKMIFLVTVLSNEYAEFNSGKL